MSVDVRTLHEEIVFLLTRQFRIAEDLVETDLIATGMLDSLALVELALALEARFNVEIALDQLELDVFRSASGIADFVSQLQSV